jgi:Nuclease-related domain
LGEEAQVGMIVVSRWTRYGKDRLYVMDGPTRLGWYDLAAKELHLEDATRADAVMEALQSHPQSRDHLAVSLEASSEACEPSEDPAPPPPDMSTPERDLAGALDPRPEPRPQSAMASTAEAPTVGDLADHRPGELARARAEQERFEQLAAHPIRGRLARLLDSRTDERAWRIGADGEETVGAKLEKLTGKGWRVLHSIPVGDRGSDIDHVLIGPGGVWTINTKRHPGARVWISANQMRINGHVVPYLRNSRHEASRATKLLSASLGWTPPIRPAIVLHLGLLADPITIKQSPDDVDIFESLRVPRAFSKRPAILSTEQIDQIYAAARDPRTWTRRP